MYPILPKDFSVWSYAPSFRCHLPGTISEFEGNDRGQPGRPLCINFRVTGFPEPQRWLAITSNLTQVRRMATHPRGGRSSPYTGQGVPFNELTPHDALSFAIHECGFHPQGIHWYFPQVLSPFWRLYYNGAPGWRVHHRGRDHELGPDRVVLIADNTLFDCLGDPGVPHLWLHFNPPTPSLPPLATPYTLPISAPLAAIVQEVIAAHHQRDSSAGPWRLYHASAALLHLTFASLATPPKSAQPARLQELLSFIEQHLPENLSNARLARQVAMGESAFIRWFREHSQITPAAWVQQARIKQAAQWLVFGRLSIEQIAADCGFPNRYYFTRVFQRQMGCGPAEYRKRQIPR